MTFGLSYLKFKSFRHVMGGDPGIGFVQNLFDSID